MTKKQKETIKNIVLLTVCGAVIAGVLTAGLILVSSARQQAVSGDAVRRWEILKEDAETQTPTVSSDNGYTVTDGERINDGIHTVNDNQRAKELEDILKKITEETAENSPK